MPGSISKTYYSNIFPQILKIIFFFFLLKKLINPSIIRTIREVTNVKRDTERINWTFKTNNGKKKIKIVENSYRSCVGRRPRAWSYNLLMQRSCVMGKRNGDKFIVSDPVTIQASTGDRRPLPFFPKNTLQISK